MDLQKKIYNFILDYWKLIKLYTPKPKEDDIETWDKLVDDVDELAKKYREDSREGEFFHQMIKLWLIYIGKGDMSEMERKDDAIRFI